ncbi:alpha/beta hydrolase [Rheinheimera gaetbuli]
MAEAQDDTSIKLVYGAEPLQFGRLYLPPEGTAVPAPLLVFIHGGCWLNAYDMVHSTAFSQAVANAGIAVWSLEYRRSGDAGGGWPGSLDDVLAGVKFAQHDLAQLTPGILLDQLNIVLAGHSAGGHLALLAATSQQYETTTAGSIRGVIGLAAITNLVSYSQGVNSCQRATEQFMAGTPQQWPGRYLLASPAMQPAPAFSLLLQGSSDSIVPIEQATDSGMPYRLVTDAGHFDWIHPQTNAYQQFLAALKELLAQ